MSFILTTLATVLALPLTVVLAPKLVLYFVAAALRALGWYIKSKTQGRRETIVNRARIDEAEHELREEEERRKRHQGVTSGSSPDDDDWEKVDATVVGTAGNGLPLDDEWEGIIGFFHPFW
jgi:alpha-1,2-mannosyltransferase